MPTQAPPGPPGEEAAVEHASSPEPIIIRELSPAEFEQLRGVGLFQHFALPKQEHTIPVVAQEQNSGKIVAYWLVFDAVHVEPLWIAEEHRHRVGLARRLWAGVQKVLIEKNVPVAFACIASHDMAKNLPQATRLGFKAMNGQLFFIEVKPENQEGWKSASEIVQETLEVPPPVEGGF